VVGKSVILTVVDRFSKDAHFIPLGHPYTATSMARAFFDTIVQLHGFPSSIVSDQDPIFTGHVWRDLFGLAGVKLRMSTTFHPKTDGQSEVVNKVIAMYLRCVTGDRPRSWVDWLSWAEYCYKPPSILSSAPPRSRSSTGAHHRRSCLTQWGRPRHRRQMRSSAAATRCWQRCASGFYRHNNSPRSTMSPAIVTWSLT
jgi:hypothetical protein